MTLLLQAQPSDWALFFGRFHPLIVHLPIGFLLIAAVLELDRLIRGRSVSPHTITTILFWSAVSATLACLFGYLLSLGGGYDEELLDEHKWQGIGMALFAWVAWVVKSERIGSRLRMRQLIYLPALGLAVLLLLSAGHHGGALTHGSDYLTQYTPEPLRSLAGIPPRTVAEFKAKPITDVNQALVYEQIVNPILQTRCVQCHNAEKAKGDLRMDTPDFLKKGGEEGPIFVAGKGADSRMVKYCLLDESDEHHMPPKGKPQLTPEQVTLLSWWIDQGASFDKKVADVQVTDAVKPALASLGGGAAPGSGAVALATAGASAASPQPVSPVLTMKIAPADATVVDALKKLGLLVMPLSKENNQLEVSAVNLKTLTDAQAAGLAKLADQLVWLKLSDTQITDATMATIGKLKNLQKLHLERTAVTDAGLRQLGSLTYLEYLNLYGTNITDAGLANLAGLKSLRTVYVWQTKTTEAGIAKLKQALPNVEIIGGMSANTVAAN
ncbi:Leucine-rich repeat, ribonuclease inhibitor subtype [Fibrella aestuarina BUZ 2]|uniref:Leucine-rich repeat, ribonuclease inhibitor subtype n=1 Tax=Fibrella aestuarina BUZ 2 TaxID=1166018 RepID=I0KH22_9BACT|nr:c-type cytochrome domain-containing protein [Fibrella aestuarina]CCH03425.1 Leucine-rich repeat, ribonuclease inhibitor subtype [Fibrella aestuarina BUZ 2]